MLTTRGWVPSRTFMFPVPTNHDTLWLTHGNCWHRPGLSLISTLYKYRLDCDTGDSCPAWPRPRHHNNNYTARTIQTTHNCYTALIWLMTGTGGQTGATLSLWVLWVFCECCHPPDDHEAWHPGVLSWEWEWGDDHVMTRMLFTTGHDKKDATLRHWLCSWLMTNDEAPSLLDAQWEVSVPHQFPSWWCYTNPVNEVTGNQRRKREPWMRFQLE